MMPCDAAQYLSSDDDDGMRDAIFPGLIFFVLPCPLLLEENKGKASRSTENLQTLNNGHISKKLQKIYPLALVSDPK